MKKNTESKIRTSSHYRNKEIPSKSGVGKTVVEASPNLASSKYPTRSEKLIDFMKFRKIPVIGIVISLINWILRVRHVTDRNNWVIINPDEVFQSMEAAHIEFYGYGFRPYEFSSPFADDGINANATLYRQMELDAGLSAMRSPIFLYYYIAVAKLVSIVGVNSNPYLIFSLGHITITSLVPISVYVYTMSLFHSMEVATVAAILTSSSIHLNVLGTHCFLHSFLSPFIFLTLTIVTSLVNESKEDKTGNELEPAEINNNYNIVHDCKVEKINNELPTQDSPSSKSIFKSKYIANLPSTPIVTVNATVCNSIMVFSVNYKAIFVGFLTGITCYIRLDSALIHFVNLLIILSSSSKHRGRITSLSPMIFVGLLISVLLCVRIDSQFYGGFTISPWNWFHVNVIKNISTYVFGEMNFWFYFATFYSHDINMFWICFSSMFISILLTTIYFYSKIAKRQDIMEDSKPTKSSSCLFLACIFLLVIYSVHGHKEIRFIHDSIIFVMIYSAYIICKLLSFINIERKHRRITFGVVLVIFWVSQHHQFYNHSTNTQWTYRHVPDTQNTNICLDFISKQSDVSGVFMEDNIFLTGGMTILHKNVPIFSRVMSGFFEFSMEFRINAPSGLTFLNTKREISMNTFTRVSNYVSQTNLKGVLLNVLETQEYNYLVLTKDQPFKRMGFHQVFENGNRKVLKRVGDSASEDQIKYIVDRLTLGDDVKTLVHEGDVLFHMRLFQKAVERYQHALIISSFKEDVVGAYLPLYECLREIGRNDDAEMIMTQCVEIHSKEKCWKPRRMTRLYYE